MQVFVINLTSSVDRRKFITKQLEKTGLDYDIVSAVDGRSLDLSDRTLVAPELLALSDFPAGAAGCALSHLNLYRKIMADGLDAALILEDDVTLPADLAAILRAIKPHLTGAEVVLLNFGSGNTCTMSRDGSIPLPDSRTLALPVDLSKIIHSGGYVVTRQACERLSAGVLPLRANADDWAMFFRTGMLDRVRCVVPLTVTKSARFESTIGLYSLGNGLRGRLVARLLRHKIPPLHQLVLYRRQRILRRWGRSELVDTEFVEKPSRLC